jgi:hypothetical protein
VVATHRKARAKWGKGSKFRHNSGDLCSASMGADKPTEMQRMTLSCSGTKLAVVLTSSHQ